METKTLIELLAEYEEKQELISDNRNKSRSLLEENRNVREEITFIKERISEIVKLEKENGKTLYQIAKECFGEIDRRFYLLYSILPEEK